MAAGTAAHPPPQIAVDCFVRYHNAAVGQHHEDADDIVAMNTEGARGEAIAAALHKSPDADVVAFSDRQVHASRLQRRVELAEIGATADVGDHILHIDEDVVQGADVDHDAAAAGIAGGGMTARTK